ncbi:MAG: PAS domain S-box protein [Planctomycetota bacterium]
MRDVRKNKVELIGELKTLRKRVSELEKAKETLQESGEKWRSLAETTPSFILTVSHDGTIQFVNRPTGGLTREQSIGTKVYEYVEPGQCEVMRRSIEKVFQTGKPDSYEILGLGPDGQNSAWYKTNLGPIVHDGKVVAVTMVSTDITERKKAEGSLRESQTLIQGLLDNTSLIVVIRDIQGRYILVNKEVENVLGMESEDIIGKTAHDIHSTDHANKILADDKRVIESRRQLYIEDQLDVKGETRTFLGSKFPLLNAAGEPYAVCTLATDITERKKAEDNLKESEQRFRAIFENAADGMLLADVESKKFYMVNSVICQMLDYSQQEFENLGVVDIHPEEDLPYVIEQFEKQARGELTLAKDIPVKRKDGGVFYADVNSFPITLEGKSYLMGIFRDITERKKADEEINKLAMFPSENPNPVLRISKDGTIIYANESSSPVLETWGIQVGQSLPEASYERVKEALNSGEASTFDFNCYDGRIFLVTLAPVVEEGYLNVYGVDITERKKIDEVLRKHKRRLEYLVSSNPAVIYTSRTSGDYGATYISENVTSLTGHEAKDFIENPSFWVDHIHPDDKKHILDGLPAIFEKGNHTHEYRFLYKDGSYQWMLDEMRLVRDEQGNPLEIIGSWINITERKQAEDALSESEERFRSLLQTAPNVILFLSTDYRILELNTEAEQIYGCKREEALGKNYLETFLPKNVRADVAEDIRKVLAGKATRNYENTIKCADGYERVFMWDVNRVLDKQGCPMGVIAAGQDITERKRSEAALAESEEKYRTLVESAGDSIVTVDENGVFLFLNKWAAKDMGGKPEDFVGKTMWDRFPKEIADRQESNVRKVIETKQGMNLVLLSEVQGHTRWYNTKIEPLKDDRGNITAVMIIARDVDEIKRAEEQIRRLSSAVESSINGIAISDLKGDLIYVNESFLKMWGYKDENEVLGKNAIEFWQIEDEASKVIETLRSRGSWLGEMTGLRTDGSAFEAQISASCVADTNGNTICMMSSFLDITESKQKEEELRLYREQMARAEELASLGTLSATVAHELTQPLTVIRLSLENALEKLEAKSSPETIKKKLKDSLTETSNINSIVERFRSFARKSTEKIVKEVNLKVIAERVVNLLKENARRARVTVHLEGMDELPSFYSNEKDLVQLFFALVDNTIHAADDKEPRQLVISGAVKEEHIELRFSDNCGGIAPENIDKIFEPFFTTKPASQGTGLGLCIVQDIVSRAGGKVRVESRFGEGSTFIITLGINE